LQNLRFVHIPKTAGTTFTQILNRQYGHNNRFQFTGDIKVDKNNFCQLTSTQKNNISLFIGHAPIYTGIDFIDGIETVTLLRDPIERVKSFCQHAAEGKSEYINDLLAGTQFNLDNFLNRGILELNNLQTKMLVNTGKCAINFDLSQEQALTTAIKNLTAKITAFGLVEYFDESLMLFKKTFNWQTPHFNYFNLPSYQSVNIKDKTKLLQFEPHHIAKIKELNKLDIELYNQAKEIFFKRLERYKFPLFLFRVKDKLRGFVR